jgi:hypothetical protein
MRPNAPELFFGDMENIILYLNKEAEVIYQATTGKGYSTVFSAYRTEDGPLSSRLKFNELEEPPQLGLFG